MTPLEALQTLYSATRQLNASAEVHELLAKAASVLQALIPKEEGE